MVKEVLRRSETSREQGIQDIILSTVAVVFLGTPHRGSPGLANLGEIVRRTASTILRVDSNATILRVLGCDSPELELCRESFTAQWREYQFRVKTFQEALGLGGIAIGRYPEKVVPDTSSLLDDTREHAETIGANHMDMVRFFGHDDPGYQKVVGELRIIIENLYRVQQEPLHVPLPTVIPAVRPTNERTQPSNQAHSYRLQQPLEPSQMDRRPRAFLSSNVVDPVGSTRSRSVSRSRIPIQSPTGQTLDLRALEQECLQHLSFAQLGARLDNIRPELEGTCQWISHHPVYREWELRHDVATHCGMLWIKGRAGAGKSVIMKKLLCTVQGRELPGSIVASFFFNARGAELERNTMGMYRSLLHQILQQDQGVRHHFLKYYRTKKETYGPWNIHENQLRNFISLHFSTPIDKPIYLFIDALDECKEDEVRSVVNYFRELTDVAYAAGNHMSVCMSSRRYPTISIARCPEINVEDGNRSDVSKYVRQKIMSHGDRTVPESLIMSVDNKASHVFLWAVLVIEMLLREWDNGTPLRELEAMLHQIPQEIEKVFDELTSNLTHQERPEALRLFQWVLLSIEPLSLGSFQYAIIFGEEKHPKSFREVFEREGEFESRQFARRITYLSRGLIEAVKKPFGKGTFIVQVIHESVRDWFLNYGGFVRLDAMLHTFPIEKGHIQIIQACTNIMQTTDFLEMHPERDQIEAPYWQSDRDHTGRNVNFKKRNDVLGITDYCANRIFGHAQRLDKSGTIPTHFLESLTKPQSLLWANMRKAYTQDMELQSHPPTHSLLTLLCSKGFEASVSWLLGGSKGQRVGPNAMKAAIRGRHFAVLDILDSHSPLSSIIDENGRNAFHFACELLTSFPHTSIQEMIRLLLRKGLDVNSRDNMGMTGFMIAVDVDRLDLLQVLFDAGACPDVQEVVDARHYTLLSKEANLSLLRIFLKRMRRAGRISTCKITSDAQHYTWPCKMAFQAPLSSFLKVVLHPSSKTTRARFRFTKLQLLATRNVSDPSSPILPAQQP